MIFVVCCDVLCVLAHMITFWNSLEYALVGSWYIASRDGVNTVELHYIGVRFDTRAHPSLMGPLGCETDIKLGFSLYLL